MPYPGGCHRDVSWMNIHISCTRSPRWLVLANVITRVLFFQVSRPPCERVLIFLGSIYLQPELTCSLWGPGPAAFAMWRRRTSASSFTTFALINPFLASSSSSRGHGRGSGPGFEVPSLSEPEDSDSDSDSDSDRDWDSESAESEPLVFGGCAFPPVSLGPAGECPCRD